MARLRNIQLIVAVVMLAACFVGCGPRKDPQEQPVDVAESVKEAVVSAGPGLPMVEPPPKSEWTITASGVQEDIFPASNAGDGKRDTRWSSPAVDPQWVQFDLGQAATICGMTIFWETAFASQYRIEVSTDGSQWETIYETMKGDGNTDDIYFAPVHVRHVKIVGTKRATGWGYSIWDVDLKGPSKKLLITTDAPTGKEADKMFDGSLETVWSSAAAGAVSIEVDFREVKAIGGLRIDWGDNYATAAKLFLSKDKENWEELSQIVDGTGRFDIMMHSSKEAQYIRIDIAEVAKDEPVVVKDISLRGPDEQMTDLAIFQLAAEKAEPGLYAEHLHKRQTYWTLVGLPNDRQESLFDEYGNLEPTFGSSSLMPYLYMDGKLISALDVGCAQSLQNGHLPLPSVSWDAEDVEMVIEAFARGTVTDSASYIRYRLMNTGGEQQKGRLFLTVRPFQINPKWQYGGLSPIRSLEYHELAEGHAVKVNGKDVYISLTEPDGFAARSFERGDIVEDLAQGAFPETQKLDGAGEWLSGALAYDFDMAPGEELSVVVACPLHESTVDIRSFKSSGSGDMLSASAAFDQHLERMVGYWAKLLDRVDIRIPEPQVIHTLKAQIGYILINRDGVAIQPGSRNYKRCWIRDGSLTAAALLRMGLVDEVREYLEWYSERVTPEGWVPPILHNNGELDQGFGWDNEYDSQGEYIFIIMEFYRFTKDKEFLAKHFDEIVAALKYLIMLRDRTLEPGYMSDHPAPERFAGILPKSISHEGYSPPMHSYWDDFFALKGWKDGKEAALALGKEDIAQWCEEQYQIFRDSMIKSMKATVAHKKIDYTPGCAEKGDPDATSTAIAFFPCQEESLVPRELLQGSFDMYYKDLTRRLEPGWVGGFTPYEIRSVAAFVGLGQNDRAKVLLDFILSCRRPQNWHHLGEVVHSDARQGSYIGDMPHTWVGSGYVNSVRAMLVRELNGKLVLLQGTPELWVRGSGIQIANLPTHFGELSMSATTAGHVLTVTLDGDLTPPEGIEVCWPLEGQPVSVEVDGEGWGDFDETSCRIPATARKVIARW